MLSSPIDEIKNRLDIVEVVGNYIKLQKAGVNYRALCPFHSEKKPSFFVSPARQIWHCFGCSKGGDMFGFVKEVEGVEFGDALQILAQKAGVELKRQDPKIRTERQRLFEICELAGCFFERQLHEGLTGKEAKKYLSTRGVKEETMKDWRVGYAPDAWQGLSDFLVSRGYKREEIGRAGLALKSEKTGSYYDRFRGRIIFPVFNLSSQIAGFGGRAFKQTQRPDNQEEAKYVNTPNTLLYDKSRILYGLNRAGVEIRRNGACVLVEGYIDAILTSQAGFKNIVATSGTALTSFQLRTLKRYTDNLLTAFDMDIAGDSATKRGIDLAQTLGFDIKVITMPRDSDPADIISQNPENWQNLVKNAKTIHDFYFETTLSKLDRNTLDGKKAISKCLLPVIKRIPNKIEKTFWIQSLAKTLKIKEEDVLEELRKTKTDQIGTGPEELIEKTALPKQKSRKELLEERLIVSAIRSPQSLNLITEKDLGIFSSQVSQTISYFKENGINNNFPVELQDLLNPLFLKAEDEQASLDKETEGEVDVEKEFESCLREIKTLMIKNKLNDISKEIKKAEEEKNFQKVQELTQKFNLCSRSRSDLECS